MFKMSAFASNTPQHPGYIAGRTYSLIFSAVSSAALTGGAIDLIYFQPFILPQSLVFTGAKMRTQTLGAASSVKAGIWANSPVSMRPLGAPLYKEDTGVTTQASTTDITLINFGAGSLQAGVMYWLGSKYTGTIPVMWGYSADNMSYFAGMTSTINTYISYTYGDTYSNNMPTIAEGGTFTNSVIVPPGIWLTT